MTLVANDFIAALALEAHFRDRDQRCVVLVWTGTATVRLGGRPNDETISGHRLYDKGLRDVMWAGLVQDSEVIGELERQNRVHPSHKPSRFESLVHHVVLLKQGVAEVVAATVTVQRHDGTLDSAVAAMH